MCNQHLNSLGKEKETMPESKDLSASHLLGLIKDEDELINCLCRQIANAQEQRRNNLELLSAKVNEGDSTGHTLEDYLAADSESRAKLELARLRKWLKLAFLKSMRLVQV